MSYNQPYLQQDYNSNLAVPLTFPSSPQYVMAQMHQIKRMSDYVEGRDKRERENPRLALYSLERAVLKHSSGEFRQNRLNEGAIISERGAVATGADEKKAGQNLKGAAELKSIYEKFLQSSYGRTLDSYLKRDHGLQEAELVGHYYGDLDDKAIAAVLTNDKESVMMADKGHWNGLKGTALELYVLAHETIHRYGVHSEQSTDMIGSKYFSQLAKNAKTEKGREIYGKIADAFYKRSTTGKLDKDVLESIPLYDLKEELEASGDLAYLNRESYGKDSNVVSLSAYRNRKSGSGYKGRSQEQRHYSNRRDEAEAMAKGSQGGSIDDVVEKAA